MPRPLSFPVESTVGASSDAVWGGARRLRYRAPLDEESRLRRLTRRVIGELEAFVVRQSESAQPGTP
jgi:hypothetical protein